MYAPSVASGVVRVRVQAPAVQVAVPFSDPAPPIVTLMVVELPAAVPQAPPTEVTVAFVESGNVCAAPLTVVRVTAGAVLSTVMAFAPLVPLLAALSAWLAVAV